MNASMPLSTLTADEIMQHWPETSEVFLRFRTDCVGCAMAGYCTLEEVIDLYGLRETEFLAELKSCMKDLLTLSGPN